MAHEAPAAPPASAPAAPASGAEQPGDSKFKLLMGGLMLAITTAECGVGWMYLPSPAVVSASEIDAIEAEAPEPAVDKHAADSKHAGGHGAAKADKHAKKTTKHRPPEQSEVDLGEFRITAFQPLSNTTVRVDMHLYGTVTHGQEEQFASLFEAKKQRFRDQVIATIRSAEMADFTEAGLGLIKRRILETTNRTIGKPCLEAVLLSDFSFIEQ